MNTDGWDEVITNKVIKCYAKGHLHISIEFYDGEQVMVTAMAKDNDGRAIAVKSSSDEREAKIGLTKALYEYAQEVMAIAEESRMEWETEKEK